MKNIRDNPATHKTSEAAAVLPDVGPVSPMVSTETTVGPSIGDRVTHGFVWMVLQSLLQKGLGFATQLVIAWFVAPASVGLVALAYPVISFVGILQQHGVGEILIQRGRRFERWRSAGLCIALTAGVLSSALIVACAPFAAMIYQSPSIFGIMAVLAISPLLSALSVVPQAQLSMQLRFRFLAGLNGTISAATSCLTILFACLGLEVWALVLPVPAVAALRAIILNSVAGASGFHWPRRRAISVLLRSNTLMLLSGVGIMVTWQGDYLILGLFEREAVVGLYFYAFNFSTQTLQLLTTNLNALMLPALSGMQNDKERMVSAYLRASRLIGSVGMSACLFQAVVTPKLFELLIGPRYQPAAALASVLAVASGFLVIGGQWHSLLQAAGRYRSYVFLTSFNAIVFLATVGIGAWTGGAMGTAVGVAIAFAVTVFFSVARTLRLWAVGWSVVFGQFAKPVALGVMTNIVPWLVCWLMPSHTRVWIVGVVLAAGISAVISFLVSFRILDAGGYFALRALPLRFSRRSSRSQA